MKEWVVFVIHEFVCLMLTTETYRNCVNNHFALGEGLLRRWKSVIELNFAELRHLQTLCAH